MHRQGGGADISEARLSQFQCHAETTKCSSEDNWWCSQSQDKQHTRPWLHITDILHHTGHRVQVTGNRFQAECGHEVKSVCR